MDESDMLSFKQGSLLLFLNDIEWRVVIYFGHSRSSVVLVKVQYNQWRR